MAKNKKAEDYFRLVRFIREAELNTGFDLRRQQDVQSWRDQADQLALSLGRSLDRDLNDRFAALERWTNGQIGRVVTRTIKETPMYWPCEQSSATA